MPQPTTKTTTSKPTTTKTATTQTTTTTQSDASQEISSPTTIKQSTVKLTTRTMPQPTTKTTTSKPTTKTTTTQTTTTQSAYTSPGYLGCFEDGFEIRILRGTFQKLIRNSGKACKEYCLSAGFRYAGTKAGFDCYCGDTIRKKQLSGECYEPCPGRHDEFCGGISEISLYDTWPCATNPCDPGHVCDDLDVHTYSCICTQSDCHKEVTETTLLSTLKFTTQVHITQKIETETRTEATTDDAGHSTVNVNEVTEDKSSRSTIIVVPVLITLTAIVGIVITLVVIKKRRQRKSDDIYHEYDEPSELALQTTNHAFIKQPVKSHIVNNETQQPDETFADCEEAAQSTDGWYELLQHNVDSSGEYTTIDVHKTGTHNKTYPNGLYETLNKTNQHEVLYSKIKQDQKN
ncbi:uncharacterized protein LOC132728434 isoform X2 [Ruditapes philippinarum]|uniref:uncharacterized protein LOC132728434 isoform X2 n=1 Tax=Ruditapes philippinarum TaxID=129788 RepID=UPI00295AFD05|nr:uncharacterized protein LOC132728434 isoform X2 [Ruditapes philippinarum]